MAERLIRTEYSGKAGDQAGHAVSPEGALRAAIIRLAHGQYQSARIYDMRFGEVAGEKVAIEVELGRTGITVLWGRSRPRWNDA